MHTTKWMTYAAATAMSVGLLACESNITGKSGNLVFSYATVDDFADFNKPLAVGAKIDLKVSEAGTRATTQLQSAESSDPEILAVGQYAGDTAVLEGISPGRVEISVTAKVPSGDVVDDAVDFEVAIPEVLKLNHTCSTAAEGYYLVDHEIWIPFSMELANGRSVIGYGYHPIDIEPTAAAALDQTTKDQRHFHLKLQDEPVTIVLTSQIDDATLTLQLIEASQIDGIVQTNSNVTTTVDATSVIALQPTIDGNRVCQANTPLEVETSTPDVCEVSVPSTPEEFAVGVFNENTFIAVRGINPGVCEITATMPAAKDGEGVSIELTAVVE